MNEAKIKCSKCGHEDLFKQAVQESPLPFPHSNIVEGVIVCSNCQERTHIYYLSSELKVARAKLERAAMSYQRLKTQKNLIHLNKTRDEYSKMFDKEQEKYKEILEKA